MSNILKTKRVTDRDGTVWDVLLVENENGEGERVRKLVSRPRTKEDDVDSMMVDFEYRITMLELGLTE